jgi:hypothetical protein
MSSPTAKIPGEIGLPAPLSELANAAMAILKD